MENLHFGLREIIESGGVLGIAVWALVKHGKKLIDNALPFLKTWQKNKTEENKLKIKMATGSTGEVVEMLKDQINELKEDNKKAQERILQLEVNLATLRERYQEHALHSRGKKK
jgi:RNase adaptor protein for sRNA GlmZ degradation